MRRAFGIRLHGSRVCFSKLFLAVLLPVGLGRFFGVPSRLDRMPRGCMSMVRRFLVIPDVVMLGRFPVVPGSMGAMF